MPLKVNVKTPPVNVPVVKSTKVPSYAPAGSYYNPSGKLVNKHGQLLNDKGQAVNNKGFLINEKNQRINAQGQLVNQQGHAIDIKGRLINDKGHLVNTNGKLINDKGKLVDTQDRLVNHSGRLIDPKGQLIDKDGKPVNREGYLIDKYKRPLDKDGKVARDLASAAKGNNEPHAQLLPPALMKKWLGKIPDPVAPQKLTISEVVTRMTDADKMVKAGIISTSPSGASVARDALISSAITGLVSAPINIGAYAGSTAAAEKIKATYLPVPLTPPTPIAKSSIEAQTNEPAPLEESVYPRMNEAQILALTVTNESIALRFGETKTKTFPDPHWPNDPLGRLDKLENMLDFAEAHTIELADEKKVFFKPELLEEGAAAEGLAGVEVRLKRVEKRIADISEAQGLILEKMKALLPASDSKP
jgi:adhesin HecA-like repeat protein